jgi:hypothetical protein
MLTKTKIGIVALALVAFVAGGFALNALDVDAFGWGKFFNGNSEEWHAKIEDWKAMTPEERQAKKEEFKAEKGECRTYMQELKDSEAWQEATQEQRKEMFKEAMEENDCHLTPPFHRFGDPFGLLKKYNSEINYDVIVLDNGIQITITSDNSDIVQKLHDFANKINNSE